MAEHSENKKPLDGALLEVGGGAVEVTETKTEGLLAEEPRETSEREDSGPSAETEERADYAADVLQAILDHMDLDADIEIRDESDEEIVLDVDGPDAGRAIGKRGQTLDALQFLVNKIVGRLPGGKLHIIVDSGDYRERYDRSLVTMAKREAKRALRQGRIVALKPMNARDRRVIHLSLAKLDGVSTASEGQGGARHIRIVPSDVLDDDIDEQE